MRIHLIFVGKTGFRDLEEAIGRYVERLRHYCSVEEHYIRAEKITAAVSEELVRAREAERIRKVLSDRRGHLIICDGGGREFDSTGFSRFLEKLINSGVPDLRLVIGGPVGVSGELLKSADSVLSFSKMTFPHDMARLILVEQLYRAFTIMKGEPYHK